MVFFFVTMFTYDYSIRKKDEASDTNATKTSQTRQAKTGEVLFCSPYFKYYRVLILLYILNIPVQMSLFGMGGVHFPENSLA